MSKSLEHARLLLEKAGEDIYVLRCLAQDPEAPEAAIGFHAQQAVEKSLKAVLTSQSIPYAKTHDIVGLLNLVRRNRISEPPAAADLPALTPYAAEFRYDRLPPEEEERPSLDRARVLRCAEQVQAWAEASLGSPGVGR